MVVTHAFRGGTYYVFGMFVYNKCFSGSLPTEGMHLSLKTTDWHLSHTGTRYELSLKRTMVSCLRHIMYIT